MGNIVAIVGRPNVGKSTFFNRLIERREAIMDDQSGVTRDRIYGQAEWTGHEFTVIDTGGYVVGSEDTFETAIRQQVQIAVEEADYIFFMVDVITGLTNLDKDFANIIRRYEKPVFLIANKVDDFQKRQEVFEFYELGLGDVFSVSAQSGSGTGELLDALVAKFPAKAPKDEANELPKITILGRPNVGKSSFANLLLGEERSIVTDEAGTTRDAIHTHYKAFGKEFTLIDTAGLRRKNRVRDNIEFYSVMRSVRSLEDADVCIVMLDASRGIESQDVNIISLAARKYKGIVIMVNKWDLIEKDTHTAKQFSDYILERIAPIDYTPILFTSVLNKQRVFQAIEKAIQVYDNLHKKISTSELNQVMLKEIERYPPPTTKGKYIRIKYVTQIPANKIPTFAFFCNLPQYIKPAYKRYLENKMRDNFDLEGVPLRLFFRKK